MDVVEQEHALPRRGQQTVNGCPVDPRARESISKTRAIVVRLESPHHRGSDVPETLVVEVDWILSREYDAHALRARMLQQHQQRPFRGRTRGMRREVSVDLVHVD